MQFCDEAVADALVAAFATCAVLPVDAAESDMTCCTCVLSKASACKRLLDFPRPFGCTEPCFGAGRARAWFCRVLHVWQNHRPLGTVLPNPSQKVWQAPGHRPRRPSHNSNSSASPAPPHTSHVISSDSPLESPTCPQAIETHGVTTHTHGMPIPQTLRNALNLYLNT